MLKEFQDEWIVACNDQPAAHAISNAPVFLKHMQHCRKRTTVAGGTFGTLAGWDSGSE